MHTFRTFLSPLTMCSRSNARIIPPMPAALTGGGPRYHTPPSWHPAVESDECLGSWIPRHHRLNRPQYGSAHGQYGSFSVAPNAHQVAGFSPLVVSAAS